MLLIINIPHTFDILSGLNMNLHSNSLLTIEEDTSLMTSTLILCDVQGTGKS